MAAATNSTPFDFNHPPPFEYRQQVLSVLGTLNLFSGGAQNAVLCVVLLWQKVPTASRISCLLTANMLAANAVFAVIEMLLSLAKTIAGEYSFGFVGCQWEGYFLSFTAYWPMSATLLLALDRYFVIVREEPSYRPRFWAVTLVSSWAVCLFLAGLPLLLGLSFTVQPSGFYCENNFGGSRPLERAVTLAVLLLHGANVLVVAIIYAGIFAKVRNVRQQLHNAYKGMHNKFGGIVGVTGSAHVMSELEAPSVAGSAETGGARHTSKTATPARRLSSLLSATQGKGKAQPQKDEVQRATFIKAVAVSAAAIVAWVPYMLVISMGYAGASQEMLFRVDVVSIAFVQLRCYVDAALVALLDPIPRRLLIRLHERMFPRRSSNSSSANSNSKGAQ
ncbi:putative G-protein coupled receptor 63 [Sorochytrium milnesiophthora]